MLKIAWLKCIMTHKQLVWDMEYGFNWSINVCDGIRNIKAMTVYNCGCYQRLLIMFIWADDRIFIVAFFKQTNIFFNGCLSLRSVSTSTSHYSGQFPCKGAKLENPRCQRTLTHKHRETHELKAPNSSNSFRPWFTKCLSQNGVNQKKRHVCKSWVHNKKPLCSSYIVGMAKSKSSNLVILMITNNLR